MNAKKDPIDMADELLSSISYMRTLLGAAGDKVKFYLSGGPQLGPYRELRPSTRRRQGLSSLFLSAFWTRWTGR